MAYTREQEEAAAMMRAQRALERRLDDIRWKHEVLRPALDKVATGELQLRPSQKALVFGEGTG